MLMQAGAHGELDLRFTGRMSREVSAMFNTLSYELRGPFNETVSALSASHGDSIDWWSRGPASRNTIASPFFHYFCCLHLVRQLIDSRQLTFDRILVDSRVMQRLVERLCRDAGLLNGKVIYEVRPGVVLKGGFKRMFGTPLLLGAKCCQIIIARVSRRASDSEVPRRPLVLIDTFMTAAYTTTDRWYGSLWENLSDGMKGETVFVPTIVQTPLRAMFATYRSLRSNARPFLIKEDYLGIADLVFAWGHRRRLRRQPLSRIEAVRLDISGLVREELEVNRDPKTTIEALLTYRCARQLKARGVEVRLSIDWYEGQALDKAWNLGFRHYFPATRRVGYRAFESYPFYLCSYPIAVERAAGVVPDVMAVQGSGTIATVREFLPDLEVVVIPSYKASYVWATQAEKAATPFTVLVALPISIHSSVRLLHRLVEVSMSLEASGETLQIVVKSHPTNPSAMLRQRLSVDFPKSMAFTEERSFSRLLQTAHLLITEASSTCLEALACGVPVIIMESEEGLTYDPVPAAVPRELYRRASTAVEVAAAVRAYRAAPEDEIRRQRTEGRRIRQSYFEPITPAGTERFMHTTTTRNTSNV